MYIANDEYSIILFKTCNPSLLIQNTEIVSGITNNIMVTADTSDM